jgi:hypothetical protein
MFVQAIHAGPGPIEPEPVSKCLKGGHSGTNHSSTAFPQVERQLSDVFTFGRELGGWAAIGGLPAG